MPYSSKLGAEPKILLLRRGDIVRWLGIKEEELDRIVKAGKLPFKILRPGGARVYLKADVKQLFLEGYKIGPDLNQVHPQHGLRV
jgi:hypothetical protein